MACVSPSQDIVRIMLKLQEHALKLSVIFFIIMCKNRTGAIRYSQGSGDENCETIKSEIHLIKEEFDELGRLQRTCNADVIVNKCEGLCNSQVQPSVITPTGFLKVSIDVVEFKLIFLIFLPSRSAIAVEKVFSRKKSLRFLIAMIPTAVVCQVQKLPQWTFVCVNPPIASALNVEIFHDKL